MLVGVLMQLELAGVIDSALVPRKSRHQVEE
jgi:hypothetical protein